MKFGDLDAKNKNPKSSHRRLNSFTHPLKKRQPDPAMTPSDLSEGPPNPCGIPTCEGAQENPRFSWAGTAGHGSASASTHSFLYKGTEGETHPV